MDISNWSVGEIARLPDHLFGPRFVIGVDGSKTDSDEDWAISDEAFPDVCMLWHLWVMFSPDSGSALCEVGLRLGNQVPPDATAFLQLEPLLMGLGRVNDTFYLRRRGNEFFVMNDIRKIILPQGRRLVMEHQIDEEVSSWFKVMAVVSSVPKDIPEWFR